jgi:uncharacterized membrane protein YphA (DoxX/SURF4 family)
MPCEKLRSFCQSCLSACGKLAWLPPLLARVSVGWVFAETGYGKLFNNLSGFISYLESLGIPLAQVQGPMVAGCELVFGALLLIGFLTRIAALPLIGIMVVAILTTKLGDIGSASDLFGISEFLYILLLLYLVIQGAGRVSVDALCKAKCDPAAK